MSLDRAFRKEAERALAQLRDIRLSATEDCDPEQQRKSLKLLKSAARKFAKHRKMLEALRKHPDAGAELEEQIRVMLLLEDECQAGGKQRQPV